MKAIVLLLSLVTSSIVFAKSSKLSAEKCKSMGSKTGIFTKACNKAKGAVGRSIASGEAAKCSIPVWYGAGMAFSNKQLNSSVRIRSWKNNTMSIMKLVRKERVNNKKGTPRSSFLY